MLEVHAIVLQRPLPYPLLGQGEGTESYGVAACGDVLKIVEIRVAAFLARSDDRAGI
jgi:hypothetical protein